MCVCFCHLETPWTKGALTWTQIIGVQRIVPKARIGFEENASCVRQVDIKIQQVRRDIVKYVPQEDSSQEVVRLFVTRAL